MIKKKEVKLESENYEEILLEEMMLEEMEKYEVYAAS